MEFKKIEKIAKTYEKIKQFHDDIIKLESIVENILKTESGITLNIKSEKQKDNKLQFDEDGSIKGVDNQGGCSGVFQMFNSYYITNNQSDSKDCINFETGLNDLLSLELIGMLIREKRYAIDSMIKSIKP
jgi:hypothetical protein